MIVGPTPSEIEAVARTATPPEVYNMAAAVRERANGTTFDGVWRSVEQVFEIHLQVGDGANRQHRRLNTAQASRGGRDGVDVGAR